MELEVLLHQAVLTFGAAVVVVLVSNRLGLPSIVGLLFTGVLIGPSALALVDDLESIHAFAELGVVFLLFSIGLELSPARLRESSRAFLVGGPLQALLTTSLGTLAGTLLGWRLVSALFFGMLLTLSSTAIVLKLYGDRQETYTPHGRVSLAILLFQDFLIVPMVVLTPILGGEVAASPRNLALRFGGSLGVLALVYLAARSRLPWLLGLLTRTKSRELFLLGGLTLCLALAFLTHRLGFSLALGAFLAGLLVSETDYSHQVFADTAPLRDLFASLFFISIGMLVDVAVVGASLAIVLGLTLALVVGKAVAVGIAVSVLGFPARTTALVALGLAQIGEFSFVLLEVGQRSALVDEVTYQLLLSSAVLSMLLTPGLVAVAPRVARFFTTLRGSTSEDVVSAKTERHHHVVIVGYGTSGSLLARVLRETQIPYVIIELNSELVRRGQEQGEPILYGDASRRAILEHAGIAAANAAVFSFDDMRALERSVALARELNPSLEILVRSRQTEEIEPLTNLGANQVVAADFETAIELYTRVLQRYHVPRNVIRAQTRVLRGEGYRMLRSPSVREGVSEALLEALAAGATEVYRVSETSAAVGKTLVDLDLRKHSGASVLAIVRGSESFANPPPDFVIESGDDLVLMGSHEQVDSAWQFLG